MENTISNEIKKEMLSKVKSLLPKDVKITCKKLESNGLLFTIKSLSNLDSNILESIIYHMN